MPSKSKNTASHRSVANCTVKFAKVKDLLGSEMIRVVFSNGEKTTMTTKRFNELFSVN